MEFVHSILTLISFLNHWINLSAEMLTESLTVECIHLLSSAARFSLPPPLPPFFFHQLPLLPKSLFASSSLFASLSQHCDFPASPDYFTPHSPSHTHAHTPLSPPAYLIPQGEGSEWWGSSCGSNERLELRAWRGAICTVTSRRERQRDNTRLPRASINAAL